MIDKPMDTMGEVLQDGDRIGLRFVRHFSHPLERVWSAITDDVLRFELEPSDGETTLTFTTWLESPDPGGAVSAAGGYHVCLNQLGVLLDTGAAPPLVERDSEARRLQDAYAEQLTATEA